MALPAGTRIGPYEVIALVGQDGMGEVYRARDRKLGRDVIETRRGQGYRFTGEGR